MLYTSMDCWVCWIVVNVLLTVTCVSVSGVFGHDDAERAHRQTSFEAVSVSARAPGSQLPWKGEGGVHVFTLKFPRVVFLKENVIYFSFFGVFFFSQVRTTALAFLKRMYEKDHLRDYIEKFALNYLQLLVHPNPPSLLFGADKDTGLPSACSQQPSLKLGVWPL